jgi:hypothetical protein
LKNFARFAWFVFGFVCLFVYWIWQFFELVIYLFHIHIHLFSFSVFSIAQVKTAIALNNCSAFFKLFNEADLLVASLMHNLYFESVRKRALETFHKTMKGGVDLRFIKEVL